MTGINKILVIETHIEQLETDYDHLITAQDYLAQRGEWGAYYVIRDIMDKINDRIDKLTKELKDVA